uniref:Uncharacterized protein n=1 Tax=Helianthus annuus TaxID=4232 RepID=A0A251T5E8_HELAN
MTPRIVGKNSKPPELEVSPEPGFIGGARKPQLSFAPFISDNHYIRSLGFYPILFIRYFTRSATQSKVD